VNTLKQRIEKLKKITYRCTNVLEVLQAPKSRDSNNYQSLITF